MAHCQDFAPEERKGPETRLKRGEGGGEGENKSPCSVDLEPLLFEAAANHPSIPFPASFFCPFPFCPLFACPQSLIVEDGGKGIKDMVVHCSRQKGITEVIS